MPKVKLERMEALKYMNNVFLWTDYNSEYPFPKGSWSSKIFGNNNFSLMNKVKDYNKLDRVLIFVKKKIKK